MNWRHTDFQSVALPTELPRRQPHMLPHPFSSSIEPPFSCGMSPLTQSKRLYYILPQAPTLYVGPNQGKGHRSPMSRTSLHRPRRNRAVWDRPAPGTRLLPSPLPLTVSPGIPLPGDGRSTDYMRYTLSKGLCRIGAPLTGRSGFAHGEFKEPAFAGLRLTGPSCPCRTLPLSPSESSPRPTAASGQYYRPPEWSSAAAGRIGPTQRLPRTWHVSSDMCGGYSRIAADVEHPLGRTLGVGAGVVVFLFKSLGPSIASPPHLRHPKAQRGASKGLGFAHSPASAIRPPQTYRTPSRHPSPPPAPLSLGKRETICLEQSNRHEL